MPASSVGKSGGWGPSRRTGQDVDTSEWTEFRYFHRKMCLLYRQIEAAFSSTSPVPFPLGPDGDRNASVSAPNRPYQPTRGRFNSASQPPRTVDCVPLAAIAARLPAGRYYFFSSFLLSRILLRSSSSFSTTPIPHASDPSTVFRLSRLTSHPFNTPSVSKKDSPFLVIF